MNTHSLIEKKWLTWVIVGLITLGGAYLRASGFSSVGIPGDELEIWRICNQATSMGEILRGDVKGSVMSFLPACGELFQNTFSMDLNGICLRLPGIIMGCCSIVVVFLLGRLVYGSGVGLIAAGLFALSPIHIQCSREIYPYVVSVAGSVLICWAIVSLASLQEGNKCRTVITITAFFVSLLLLMHSSVAAWPAAFLFAAAFVALAISRILKPPRQIMPVVISFVAVGLAVLPKLWPYVVDQLSQGSMKHGRATAYSDHLLVDPMGFRFITNFAWGGTPLRVVFTVAVIGGVCLSAWLYRKRRITLVLPCLLVAGFLVTMVARYKSGNPFYPRFLVTFLPMYSVLLAAALALPFQYANRIRISSSRLRFVTGSLPTCVAFVLLLQPAYLSATIKGRPAPYGQIVEWADANLPSGSPVLCDRYFDAWNEFKVNAPTGVVFMSTIPNEPLERYQQAGWRDSAIVFSRDNPDAAFYETKMFWNKIGPWEWPESFFASKQTFADSSFLTLDRLGLTYRTIPSSYSREWLPKTIYYNTLDDLEARARSAGTQAIAVFGSGWEYMKARDFSDWRLMRNEASITLCNMSDGQLQVRLKVVAVAPQQPKSVLVSGRRANFPANQPINANIGPLDLKPGRNIITLEDPAWSRRQVPLMVKRLGVEPAGAN